MGIYLAALGFGLVTASVVAIAAVGFTMQFAITNMINLAYGQVMIVSAYAAYVLNHAGFSIWLGLVVGAVCGSILSFLLNRFIYGPFKARGTSFIGLVIVALAVSLMVANLMLAIVGPDTASYTVSNATAIEAGPVNLSVTQVLIMALAVVLMLGVHLLLRYTKLGKAMRATAANPTLARNCGIPTGRVIDAVWLITGALCGVAGTVAAMDSGSFAVATGAGFLITVLAAAVLGGVGQPYGAMLGALLIGLMTELSAAFLAPEYKEVIAFSVLVLVMVLRPQGLLSKVGALRAAG